MNRTTCKPVTLVIVISVITAMLISMPAPAYAAAKVGSTRIVSIVNNDNKVIIRWSKASNASKYQVYVSTNGKTYKRAVTTSSRTYRRTIKSNTRFKVRGINGSSKGRFSAVKKATYKKPINSITLTNGHRIVNGKTYNASYLGDNKTGRRIKVWDIDDWGIREGCIYAADVNNGGTYKFVYFNNKKSDHYGKLALEYDALSTYKKDHGIDTTKKWRRDYFSYLGNGDQSKQIKIFSKDIVIYETVDGTAPTEDNHYIKITKADGVTNTYPWGYHKSGLEWIRAYKGDKVVFENVIDMVAW